MGIEQEGRNAERQDGKPEIYQMGNPYGHGGVQQDEQVPHAHVDTWASEPRVKNTE